VCNVHTTRGNAVNHGLDDRHYNRNLTELVGVHNHLVAPHRYSRNAWLINWHLLDDPVLCRYPFNALDVMIQEDLLGPSDFCSGLERSVVLPFIDGNFEIVRATRARFQCHVIVAAIASPVYPDKNVG